MTDGLRQFRRFTLILGIVSALLAAVPFLLGIAAGGSSYLGYQYNLDDHMVYSAWMRQAIDGAFLFDNRFTLNQQPGLTIHLYFLALGWVAKLTGIGLAATLARIGFSILFVWLLGKLVWRVTQDPFTAKLAMLLSVFSGGLGFAVWHNFGQLLQKPSPLSGVMLGRLPNDVWQPEGFVFTSMLTNSLFMVSLCLILVVFLCFLNARDSWKHMPLGFVSMLLLMNIHSYDVLLVALVMVAFLATAVVAKQVTGAWVVRSAAIALGAIPAALWFMHVLRNDPVFQARAATETYSPNFRQLFFGYVLLLGGAFLGPIRENAAALRRAGFALAAVLILGMFFAAASQPDNAYWMTVGVWVGVYCVAVGALALSASPSPALNLVWCWGVVGLVAPYFPALFQRKLAMGLSVPWAILAALGIALVIRKLEGSSRRLATALVVIVLAATSLRWLVRELELQRQNVSNTTLHPVQLDSDVASLISALDKETGRKVVLCPPGINSPAVDQQGQVVPDEFFSPALPDLNPIVSGLTGAYTYAGHWSETPSYSSRRNETLLFFVSSTPDAARSDLVQKLGVTHLIAPKAEVFGTINLGQGPVPFADVRGLGETVAESKAFRLIRVRR